MDDPRAFVQSLERGLTVLRSFDADPPGLTLSEVAERAGMSPAAARRYLHTLVQLDYLSSHGRRFYPRPRLLELAYPYFAASGITRAVEAELGRLADRLHESCALTVLDGHDALNVFCVNEPEGLSIQLRVGRRLPTYCTAMGRALLSGHSDDALREHFAASELTAWTPHTVHRVDDLLAVVRRVRQDGYAVGDQEYELGVRTIAIPIRDKSNQVVVAASVSTPTARVPMDTLLGDVRTELAATVAAIDQHLGARGHRDIS